MASKLGEIYIELAAVDSKYRTSLQKAQGDAEKSARAVEMRWQGVGTAIAGAFAALGIVEGAKYAVNEAMEAEQAHMKLAAALALTGDATTETMAALTKAAKAIQSVTVYEDDAVIASMAYGKSIGIQTSRLTECARAAVGLAEITGQDLNSAMLAVGRASQGTFGRLKMLLPAFKETGNAAMDFANLLKLAEGGFSLAEAHAKTTGGALEQMRVTLGNLAESFGALLLPALQQFAAIVTPVVKWLSEINPVAQSVIVSIAGLAVVVGGAIAVLGGLATAWGAIAKTATAAAVAQYLAEHNTLMATVAAGAAVAAIAGVTEALKKSAKETDDYMDKLNATLKNTVSQIGKVSDAGKKMEKTTRPKIIGVDLNAIKEKYQEQAKSIYEVYQNIRRAREEDEKRMRSAIGWTALADLWKGAAGAGARARFPEQLDRRDVYTNGKGVTYGGGKFAVDPEDWKKALRIWEKQKDANERTEAYLNDIANRLMSGGMFA